MYEFGPVERPKVLILDMDETLIHAKFFQETYDDLEKAGLGFIPPENEGDCAQFNLLLGSSHTDDQKYVRLNVKVR